MRYICLSSPSMERLTVFDIETCKAGVFSLDKIMEMYEDNPQRFQNLKVTEDGGIAVSNTLSDDFEISTGIGVVFGVRNGRSFVIDDTGVSYQDVFDGTDKHFGINDYWVSVSGGIINIFRFFGKTEIRLKLSA